METIIIITAILTCVYTAYHIFDDLFGETNDEAYVREFDRGGFNALMQAERNALEKTFLQKVKAEEKRIEKVAKPARKGK